MNPKYRILIPIALAVAAAAANFVLLKRATATTSVLVLTGDIPAGQPITLTDLRTAPIRADADALRSAFPADEATTLLGLTFRRDLRKGEIVLTADVDVEGQSYTPRAGERAGDLLVRHELLPPGLTPNTPIEFVVRWSGGSDDGRPRTIGPFRYMGSVIQMSSSGKEKYARVCVAAPGNDIDPLNEFKAAVSFDRGRTESVIAMQRVNPSAAVAGSKVAARPQPAGQ